MSKTSVGAGPGSSNGGSNENVSPAVKPEAADSKTMGEYGKEGTNKTLPEPKPDGAPSEELGNAVAPKHSESSPYTRG